MKKTHILIPQPKSSFLFVACPNCGKETVVFSHTTIDVLCKACGATVAEKTGSKAMLRSKNFKRLDQVSE